MNLSEYLAYRGGVGSVRHAAERIGQTLAALHCSPARLPEVDSIDLRERFEARIADAETTLRTLSSGSSLANRFRAGVQRLTTRPGSWARLDPIHGSLGWDCIYYGVDARFYLYRFEKSCRSDAGLDLGGFAADLLGFTLDHYGEQAYRVCRDELLKHYNAMAAHPTDADDLRVYTVLALCQRHQVIPSPSNAAVDHLITALAATLREEPSAA